jgi:hypothetical protein
LIKGDTTDNNNWGCTILTSDMQIGNLLYPGSAIMDNVEIWNCSQQNIENAALRFDSTVALGSNITNSAIHSGLGWGVLITMSE